MNLYYVNITVVKKVKGSSDIIENVDFAIPANTSDEALEKSKVYGVGVLNSNYSKLNKDWG